MRVVEQARFSSAFTFQYSIREGTPAATMADQVPKAVVQERYDRLIALQERISLRGEPAAASAARVEVLVSMGEGKKDAATHRLTGRAEDNRLVHFEVPAGSDAPAPRRRRVGDHHPRGAVPPARRLARRRAAAHPSHARGRRRGTARRRSPARSPRPGGIRRPARVSLGLPTLRSRREPLVAAGVGTMPIYDPSDSQRRRDSSRSSARPAPARPTLSLDLAEALRARGRAAEIVNADAMQLYRGMDIGTAKLPLDERRGIPHHLLDVLEVTDEAAVAWYQPMPRARDRRHPRPRTASRSSSAGRACTFERALRLPLPAARTPRCEPGSRPSSSRARPGPAVSRGSARRPGDRRERRPAERATHRARARGARTGEPTHGARCPTSPCRGARTDHRALRSDRATSSSSASTLASSGCGATGSSTRSRDLVPRGLERGVTARRAIGYAQALAQLNGG